MHAAKQRSGGFTLISMLVGLVIGVLSIAAMLVLYRSLITAAQQINTQAANDGQIATSSLVSQQQLQQAGFGISSAAPGTDLVVLTGAALAKGQLSGTAAASYGATVTGNAVIWGYNPTGISGTPNPSGYLCEGLIVTNSVINGVSRSVLQWLSPVGCSNAAQWQSVNWQGNQLASIPTASIGTSLNFQVTPATCWPYGQTTAISSLQVSYYQYPQTGTTAPTPASGSTASTAQFEAIPFYSICLPNFNL
ncbi:hypothetical protein [Dyella caseinilytica]|uniref:Tfp pilus assembly protein PilX n=1 Tax=Dyella caseinilytica TaxID=1849581 RepID=A0ABX7H0N0_9GAMM|nr:hypothetical protein [Dyella caseinilytica]QRN55629.1 hypothetical protein ISN74_10055 [Dyella caseinilytica]GGA03230.1 hypothetical protein GCM10011408_25920 [Dyella caseinilytica]